MPWTAADIPRFNKGVSAPEDKRLWVRVANEALARCQRKGGRDCEALAIRAANAAVQRKQEGVGRTYTDMGEVLFESVADLSYSGAVDREAGIIRGVAILGPQSKNGYAYALEAVQKAVPLFEGARFFLDHPRKSDDAETSGVRGVRELAGCIENVHTDGAKLRGDMRVLKHAAELVFNIAEQMPDKAGLSINARGKMVEQNGARIVEEITAVKSVDLVTAPATTESLFEQHQGSGEGPDNKESSMELKEAMEMIAAKDADIKTLTAERDELKAAAGEAKEKLAEAERKLDEYKVAEALAEKKATRDKLLEAAKLPKEAVSELFLNDLLSCEGEAEMKDRIEDRAAIAESAKGKPRSAAKKAPGDEDGDDKIAPEAFQEAVTGW